MFSTPPLPISPSQAISDSPLLNRQMMKNCLGFGHVAETRNAWGIVGRWVGGLQGALRSHHLTFSLADWV